jgi:hypothetical protein
MNKYKDHAVIPIDLCAGGATVTTTCSSDFQTDGFGASLNKV